MGLGQESDREGEVVSREAGESACDLVAMASATKRYFLLSAHHLAFSVTLLAQAHQ